MDERGHPEALEPKCKRYQNSCCTGLANKAHRLSSFLPGSRRSHTGFLHPKTIFRSHTHLESTLALWHRFRELLNLSRTDLCRNPSLISRLTPYETVAKFKTVKS